jgi:hypothetical protein
MSEPGLSRSRWALISHPSPSAPTFSTPPPLLLLLLLIIILLLLLLLQLLLLIGQPGISQPGD